MAILPGSMTGEWVSGKLNCLCLLVFVLGGSWLNVNRVKDKYTPTSSQLTQNYSIMEETPLARKRKYRSVDSTEQHSNEPRPHKHHKSTLPSTPALTDHIELWLSNVEYDNQDHDTSHQHDVARMEHGSDAHSNSTRRSQSRSSSPTKPLTVQTYRAQVLKRLNINIDVVVPSSVKEKLLPQHHFSASRELEIAHVATTLYLGARQLYEQSTAAEADWSNLIADTIRSLKGDQLHCLPDRCMWTVPSSFTILTYDASLARSPQTCRILLHALTAQKEARLHLPDGG